MQNWKQHITEFPKAKNPASEGLTFSSCVTMESLCSGWPLPVQLCQCKWEVCVSSPPQHNHSGQCTADLFSCFLLKEQKGKTVMALADLGTPDCFSSQVPCWGPSCQGLQVEIVSGTDPDRETSHVQLWTVSNLLVNLREVTPGPCSALTACTVCIMYVTSTQTGRMQ